MLKLQQEKKENEEFFRKLKEKQENNQRELMEGIKENLEFPKLGEIDLRADKFGQCTVCETELESDDYSYCMPCANTVIDKIAEINSSLIDVVINTLKNELNEKQGV